MAKTPQQPNLARIQSGNPSLDAWLKNATELLETFRGQRGNELDRALTVRDLTPNGVSGFDAMDILRGVAGNGGVFLHVVVAPDRLSNLATVSGLGVIFLSWDGTNQLSYSHTEVWRSAVDNLATAVKLATTVAPLLADYTGDGTEYFYWVRAISTSGTPGPYNSTAGTSGQAALDPAYVLDVLQGSITKSELLADLRAEIDTIATLAAATGNQLYDPDFKLTVAAGDATFWSFNGTNRVWDGTGGTSGPTAIIDVTNGTENALRSAFSYLATPGDTVYVKFNFRTTALYDGGDIFIRVIAYNADETLSANYGVNIPVLDAGNIEQAEGSVVLAAAYTDHYRIEIYPHQYASNGHDLKLENMYAGLVPQNIYAAVLEEITIRADADTALASSITTLGTSVGDNAAAILVEQTARIDADGTLAQSVTTLAATVGDNTAAVQTEATARVDADGLLNAEYTVKVNANGHIAGMGIAVSGGASGPITSEIIMLADKFAIVTPTADEFEIPNIPFIVGNVNGTPTVGVDGQLVVDGSITANHIAVGEVGATHISVADLDAISASMGTLTSGTIQTAQNPAWRTEISSVGNLPIWFGANAKSEANGRFYLKNDGSMVIRDHTGTVIMQTFAGAAPTYNSSLDNAQQAWDSINNVPAAQVYNNLIDPSQWVIGSNGTQGDFIHNGPQAENQIILGAGPFGYSQPLWECVNDAASDADGGWRIDVIKGFDHTKSYRFSAFIKRNQADGNSYLGCSTTGTNNLDGAENTNPYFVSGFDPPQYNKWYLMVGVLHGSGWGTTDTLVSGLYDPVTGEKVIVGNEFKSKVTATMQRHRAYLYYATDTATRQYFANPRVEEINGNEIPLAMLMGAADVTSENTAAGINGQGALATQNTADFGTDVSGTKPEANATHAYNFVPDSDFSLTTGAFDYTYWDSSGQGGGTSWAAGFYIGGDVYAPTDTMRLTNQSQVVTSTIRRLVTAGQKYALTGRGVRSGPNTDGTCAFNLVCYDSNDQTTGTVSVQFAGVLGAWEKNEAIVTIPALTKYCIPTLSSDASHFGSSYFAEVGMTDAIVTPITAASSAVHISSLAILTDHLEYQAVTIPESIYTAGDISVSGWTAVQSRTITSSGAPILINASAYVRGTIGGSQYGARIKEGATIVWEGLFLFFAGTTGATGYVSPVGALTRTPGVGAVTYTLEVYVTAGKSGFASRRSMFLLETKK